MKAFQSIDDPDCVLIGEAKISADSREYGTLLDELKRKASQCPLTKGKKTVYTLWIMGGSKQKGRFTILNVSDVINAHKDFLSEMNIFSIFSSEGG